VTSKIDAPIHVRTLDTDYYRPVPFSRAARSVMNRHRMGMRSSGSKIGRTANEKTEAYDMSPRRILIALSALPFGLCFAGQVHAITLPDSGSCSTGSGVGCLQITQTGAGHAFVGSAGTGAGVYGFANTGVAGVVGSSSAHIGVEGISSSGVGVYGTTGHANAILGVNTDTDGSAAAMSAIPGSSSGLAYWGG
jgi:hypothetical protein